MLIYDFLQACESTLAISLAILGYASVFLRFAPRTEVLPALGIILYTSLIFLSGSGHLYNAVPQSILLVVGLLLLFLNRIKMRQWIASLDILRPKALDWLWLIFPLLFFFVRFIATSLPAEHSDPLYYHLLAPKFWAWQGRIFLTPEHPSYAQSTLWELLYGLPRFWSRGIPVDRDIIAQLSGQQLHFIWGQVGTWVAAAFLLRRFIHTSRWSTGKLFFIAWLCTTLPEIEWTGGLAKNDYILFLFIAAGVLELLGGRFWVAGLCLGYAFSTKYFAFWTIAAIPFLLPLRVKAYAQILAGGIAGAALIIARNLVFTGNPVFPAFDDKIGPFWTGPSWSAANSSFAGAPEFSRTMLEWALTHLAHGGLTRLLIAIGVVGYLVASVRKRKLLQPALLAFFCTQFVLVLLILKPAADGRYGTPVLSMFLLWLVALTHRYWLDALPRPKQIVGIALATLALFVNIPLDLLVKAPRHFWFTRSEQYLEQFHPMYPLLRALNYLGDGRNGPTNKVFMAGEKRNFYLQFDTETPSEMRNWDLYFASQTDPATIQKDLRSGGYRYLVVHLPGMVRTELMPAPSQRVYAQGPYRVYDLQK